MVFVFPAVRLRIPAISAFHLIPTPEYRRLINLLIYKRLTGLFLPEARSGTRVAPLCQQSTPKLFKINVEGGL